MEPKDLEVKRQAQATTTTTMKKLSPFPTTTDTQWRGPRCENKNNLENELWPKRASANETNKIQRALHSVLNNRQLVLNNKMGLNYARVGAKIDAPHFGKSAGCESPCLRLYTIIYSQKIRQKRLLQANLLKKSHTGVLSLSTPDYRSGSVVCCIDGAIFKKKGDTRAPHEIVVAHQNSHTSIFTPKQFSWWQLQGSRGHYLCWYLKYMIITKQFVW